MELVGYEDVEARSHEDLASLVVHDNMIDKKYIKYIMSDNFKALVNYVESSDFPNIVREGIKDIICSKDATLSNTKINELLSDENLLNREPYFYKDMLQKYIQNKENVLEY